MTCPRSVTAVDVTVRNVLHKCKKQKWRSSLAVFHPRSAAVSLAMFSGVLLLNEACSKQWHPLLYPYVHEYHASCAV